MSDRPSTPPSLPQRGSDSPPRWWAMVVVSVLVHGGLAGGLTVVAPAGGIERRQAIELSDRDLPPPPEEIEQESEPAAPEPAEPEPEPEAAPVPRRRVVSRPQRPIEPRAEPQAEPTAQPQAQPQDRAAEPTGPKIFGIPDMESTAQAPAGQGVAVPSGDSLAVSPKIRKRGPPSKGFKKDYAVGERAPLSVITTRPRPLSRVQPVYPQRLQDLGIEGRVVLELTIDGNGAVVGARVLRGLHPELDQQALVAARRMRFSPARVNDTPVKTKITYSFVFVLD